DGRNENNDYVPEGTYSIQFVAKDTADNQTIRTCYVSVVYDAMPPVISDLELINTNFSPNNDEIKDYTKISFSISDDLSAQMLTKVRVYQNNTLITSLTDGYLIPGPYEFIWNGLKEDQTSYSDGTYQLRIEVYDNVKNSTGTAVNVVLDNIKPEPVSFFTVPRTISPNDDDQFDAVTLNFAVKENLSGSVNLSIDLYDDSLQIINNLFRNPSYEVQAQPPVADDTLIWDGKTNGIVLPDNEYWLVLQAEDLAGNMIAVSNYINIDTAGPETYLVPDEPRYYIETEKKLFVNSDTGFYLEPRDDSAGVSNTFYAIQNHADDPVNWNLYVPFNMFNLIGNDGDHYICFYSIDKAANREKINTNRIILDNTSPVSSLIPSGPLYERQGKKYAPCDYTYTILATDNLSGVKKIICSTEPPGSDLAMVTNMQTIYYTNALDGTVYTNIYITIITNYYTTFNDYTGPLQFTTQGTHILRYAGMDNVDNMENISCFTVITPIPDQTPPDVPRNLTGYIENSTNVVLYWDKVTNSDLTGYNVYDNGIKIADYKLQITNYLFLSGVTAGTHRYTVSSVDWIQNESGLSSPCKLILDKSMVISRPVSGEYYRKIIKIKADINIKGPKWKKKEYRLVLEYGSGKDPDSWKTIKEFKHWALHHYSLVYPWILREKAGHKWIPLNGEYRLRIRLIGKNSIWEDSRLVWIDNQAPETVILNTLPQKHKDTKDTIRLQGNELVFNPVDPVVSGIASGIQYTKYQLIKLPKHTHPFHDLWDKFKDKHDLKWWEKHQDDFEKDDDHELFRCSGWQEWNGDPVALDKGEYHIWYYSADNAKLWVSENDWFIGNKENINFNLLIVTNIVRNTNINAGITLVTTGGEETVPVNNSGETGVTPEVSGISNTGVIGDIPAGWTNSSAGTSIYSNSQTNENSQTNIPPVENDIEPPVILVSGVENNRFYTQPVNGNILIKDARLKEYYAVLNKAGRILWSYSGITQCTNTNIRFSVSDEAEYKLTVQARDSSSNIANTCVDFGIDKTWPAVYITGVEDKGVYFNEVKPIITVVEEHPAVIWTNLAYSRTNAVYSNIAFYPDQVLTNAGMYCLSAGCSDKAGNTTCRTAEFGIKESPPEELLLFRADYNTNTDADYSKGEKKDFSGAKITEGNQGKDGEALKSLILGDSRYARYEPEKNIDKKQGTMIVWLKPFWTTANYIGKDQGRYIFTLYGNSVKGGGKRDAPEPGKYSIMFAVFREKGTTVRIRYMDDRDQEYVNTLSVDTNKHENMRWYRDGAMKWTQLALSWDSDKGVIKIYIDGELAGRKEFGKWEPYDIGKENWMKIGSSDTGIFTEFWGYMDKMRIYSQPLTDKQVKVIYNSER
ncbi:MAG: Ig-like domain-containing protein, partial [bacterium]|nr:Ig-like domain-containing protein [bacterium]